MTTAYPLAWPEGWPRTAWDDRKNGDSAFKRQIDNGRYRSGQPWTFAAARDALVEEIWRHGAKTCVVSSNFQTGKNFLPLEGKKRPQEEGVAIYFERSGKSIVMACDRYHDAEGNMRSLCLALEALRQLERHGGGVMLERAFQGFSALPPPEADGRPAVRPQWPWRLVLGFPPTWAPIGNAEADKAAVTAMYRNRARECGPDHPDLLELNLARDAAIKELGA